MLDALVILAAFGIMFWLLLACFFVVFLHDSYKAMIKEFNCTHLPLKMKFKFFRLWFHIDNLRASDRAEIIRLVRNSIPKSTHTDKTKHKIECQIRTLLSEVEDDKFKAGTAGSRT